MTTKNNILLPYLEVTGLDGEKLNIEKLIKLFKDYYMPKRSTYHSQGDFFWAKQEENETPEEHWRKLVSLEKNCEFIDIKQEDLLISKFITSMKDKKLREKLMVFVKRH